MPSSSILFSDKYIGDKFIQVEALKNYLKDYTLLDEQEKDGIVVWEEYLVYSVLFNQNKKMIEKYKSIVK